MTIKEMARKGGQAKSEAKAKAAKENGKKGGRPKKILDTTITKVYDIDTEETK